MVGDISCVKGLVSWRKYW